MLTKLKKLSSKLIDRNPFWEYKIDEYEYPNGDKGNYYYVNSPGSTMVVPRLSDGVFVLTKQYRYLNREECIEFPGGGMRPGASPEENAAAELLEESGYAAGSLKYLGRNNPCNGLTNEICNVYLACDLELRSPRPDDSEEFEIFTATADEINDMIRSGIIWDGMTLAAWSVYYFSEVKK